MELYRTNNFKGEKLREKNLSFVDIFEEIPIKVSSSALISAFMTELEADTPVTQIISLVPWTNSSSGNKTWFSRDEPLRNLCFDDRVNPKVADLWSDGLWSQPKLLRLHYQYGLPRAVIDDILNIPILAGEKDLPRWTLSPLGNFTVTSVWESNRAHRPIIPAWAALWNDNLTTSMSIFLWRLLSNRIPVDAKLQWRKIELASKCLCCPESPKIETLQHLFVNGLVASKVWKEFCCPT
ncbi:zeta-carotene isomerase [Salvia divinorum]|uniref:Zeta-carotene isomerase n=1 Tax=Salvia divinorum TaxID=28513 RepID=A0ABD1FU99_SALDI